LDEVVLVIKTGQDTIKERVPAQIETFAKLFMHKMIISDCNRTELMGVPVENVISKDVHQGRDGWERDQYKFYDAFRIAATQFPGKKWFMLIDDDPFMLVRALRHRDPQKHFYLGAGLMFDMQERGKKIISEEPFAHGGAGIVLSRKTANWLRSSSAHECESMETLLKLKFGDVRLAFCLKDKLNLEVTQAFPFFDPHMPLTEASGGPCAPRVSFHHLQPRHMNVLFEQNMKQGEKNSRLTRTEAARLLFMYTAGPDGVAQQTAFEPDQVATLGAGVSCSEQCRLEPLCWAWVETKASCGFKLTNAGAAAPLVLTRSRDNSSVGVILQRWPECSLPKSTLFSTWFPSSLERMELDLFS